MWANIEAPSSCVEKGTIGPDGQSSSDGIRDVPSERPRAERKCEGSPEGTAGHEPRQVMVHQTACLGAAAYTDQKGIWQGYSVEVVERGFALGLFLEATVTPQVLRRVDGDTVFDGPVRGGQRNIDIFGVDFVVDR